MNNTITRIGLIAVMPFLAIVFCFRVFGAMVGFLAGLAAPVRRGRKVEHG